MEEDSKQEPESRENVEDERERCLCGNTREHHMVSPVPTYTAWGTFWMNLMGVSSVPIRIDFECRICKDRFDFTTKKEELEKYL